MKPILLDDGFVDIRRPPTRLAPFWKWLKSIFVASPGVTDANDCACGECDRCEHELELQSGCY